MKLFINKNCLYSRGPIMAKTISKAENLLHKADNAYTNPEQLSTFISEAMRQRKEQERAEREELIKIV